MKPRIAHLALCQLLLLINCQSKEQIEADKISGGWTITQISYSQRGSNTVDSTVTYPRAVFEFGSCQLNASNRECYGYYSLNGLDRTAIVYSISASESRLNLAPIDQTSRRGLDLTGGFQMGKVANNTIYLTGPAGYTDQQDKFHLQAFDVKLTLVR
jgi:hypothetical protein